MNQPVTVGLVQHACGPDVEENTRKTIDGIREAAGRGANVICTQELFRSRYFCQSEDHGHFALAESIPGPTTELLGPLAAETGAVIVASLFERRAPGLFHNTSVVLDADGTLMGRYRKMHIPDDPLFYEKFYFTPGDLGFKAWRTRNAHIGTLICWDQWYPEAARLTAMAGAQILFYPTAIGWHPSEKAEHGATQHSAWETIQRSHAIANGVYVVAVNRVGFEPTPGEEGPDAGIAFWGQSFVCAPNGDVLARATVDQEEVLVVPIDLDRVEESRTHWPFLRDRRIDAYSPLTRRYLDEEER